MVLKMSKEKVQEYAVGVVNYTLLNGPIHTLDIEMSGSQLMQVGIEMLNYLGYFLENLCSSSGVIQEIMPWGLYGLDWDTYDTLEAINELEKISGTKLQPIIVPIEKKQEVQILTRALVHYIYRNRVIEDYHSNPKTNLQDSYMKQINKYMMDRLGFFIEHLNLNTGIVDVIIESNLNGFDEFPKYDITEPKKEMEKLKMMA